VLLVGLIGCVADPPDTPPPPEDLCGDDPFCETPVDTDGDGVVDPLDEFPDDADEWGDLDGDGIGDASDDDIDGDGVPNGSDERPLTPDVAIVDTLPSVVIAGREASFPLIAESPYGAVIAWALESGPPGAAIDGAVANVTWTPAAPGEQTFVLAADDGVSVVRRTLRTVAIASSPGATAVIGAAGGTVEVVDTSSPAFGARLVVPAGALEADTTITISSVDAGGAAIMPIPDSPAAPESLLVLEPHGLMFAVHAELRFPAALAAGAFIDPSAVTAFALAPGVEASFRAELIRREADGTWVAEIARFSVFGAAESHDEERRTLVSSPTGVDRRAQELAVQCANRLACAICRGETTGCGAWATFARCLYDAYQQASEEVWIDTGALFTSAPLRWLASFYDLSVDPGLKQPLLNYIGEDGPAGMRPGWLKTHDDGGWGSGFRVWFPEDNDRTGRHDHFTTNARIPPFAWVAQQFMGENSQNDLRINSLGRTFGTRVLTRLTWGGAALERWLRTNLCETMEPTAPTQCLGGSGPGGCCAPAPMRPCRECAHLTGCGYCADAGTCEVQDANSCSMPVRWTEASIDTEAHARARLDLTCPPVPPPTCSMAGAACGASGPMCCTGLSCVLGDCYDCTGTGRVGDTCDPGAATPCCGTVACAAKSSADDWRCCHRDGDPCTSNAECCGQMQCVGGTCRCNASGSACFSGLECCGGSICDGGTGRCT
jgi:hypothetical protein